MCRNVRYISQLFAFSFNIILSKRPCQIFWAVTASQYRRRRRFHLRMTPLLLKLGGGGTPQSGGRTMTLNYWQLLGKVARFQGQLPSQACPHKTIRIRLQLSLSVGTSKLDLFANEFRFQLQVRQVQGRFVSHFVLQILITLLTVILL
jgi:hypothetical protein